MAAINFRLEFLVSIIFKQSWSIITHYLSFPVIACSKIKNVHHDINNNQCVYKS